MFYPSESDHDLEWRNEDHCRPINLSLNQYQAMARRFSVYPPDRIGDVPVYPALGLTEEAGEVAGKLKKIIRDKKGVIGPDERRAIMLELGDVLWYAAALCSELRIDLEDVARMNIEKLTDRQARDVLGGSGDAR